MSSIFSVENLSSTLGDAPKLQDISLTLDKGELVTVLGANGAGKSTLLGVLAGLFKPTRGSVILNGRQIAGQPSHKVAKAGLALAPQDHPIFESLTIEENLTLGTRPIEQWLFDMFPNLAHRRGQPAGELSGGERQMLSMAQALMTHPEVLLLDEPSSGLAPKIVQQVFEAVRSLVQREMTVLMVEQNAKGALKLAHRVYVMEHGRIALQGSPAEITVNDHVRKAYLGL